MQASDIVNLQLIDSVSADMYVAYKSALAGTERLDVLNTAANAAGKLLKAQQIRLGAHHLAYELSKKWQRPAIIDAAHVTATKLTALE